MTQEYGEFIKIKSENMTLQAIIQKLIMKNLMNQRKIKIVKNALLFHVI
ncbi:hypothetical protein ONA22_03800 [Mycoplasmopsis cynos]|nr:hypothetical protein [Mycoplasmopsis cynos]WAM04087.1 hypothetical protein ONA22_03800 [Mycoplasmopsis cynos]